MERSDRGSSPVCRTCGGIGQDDAAVAAMLADAARFSSEAIAADVDAWERQREAQRDAMPATLATPF